MPGSVAEHDPHLVAHLQLVEISSCEAVVGDQEGCLVRTRDLEDHAGIVLPGVVGPALGDREGEFVGDIHPAHLAGGPVLDRANELSEFGTGS